MAAIRLAWRPTGLNPFYPLRKRSSRDTGSRADNFRIVYIAEPRSAANMTSRALRPSCSSYAGRRVRKLGRRTECSGLQGRIWLPHPAGSSADVLLSTQVRKRVRLGQS
jgi:hypothetical protein